MQRYFVGDEAVNENRIAISGGDFHHIRNVMRMNIGDELVVTTFSGSSFKTRISSFNKGEVVVEIIERLNQSDNTLNISLAQALIRRENFELVLQKATELGVREIFPLKTERQVIKLEDISKKKFRYEAIVKEASEQSERAKMPIIRDLSTIESLPYHEYDHILIAYARHDAREFKSIISQISSDKKVLVLVGPEGGFSEREIEFLKTKGQLVLLGDTILRSETAGIYIVSAFRFIWGG